MKTYADFRAVSDAGRRLCDLHVNYETVEPYPVTYKQGDPRTWVVNDPEAFYRVTKMKFAGKRGDTDKTTVIYNAYRSTEGFTCKSNLTDCADEYDGLQMRFNALVTDYNNLLEDSRELREAFQTKLEELDETRDALSDARSDLFFVTQQRDEAHSVLDEVQGCIEDLGWLDGASNCLP